MYKHILLPTDGSVLSRRAIESGISLAKALGARVTGLHVIANLASTSLEGRMRRDATTSSRLKEIFIAQASRYLGVVEAAADAAGVRCKCLQVAGNAPYEQILKTAAERHCDLIYMASHGNAGMSGLLLGSETAKVLMHSPIPVLVHRERASVPIATRLSPAVGTKPRTKRVAANRL